MSFHSDFTEESQDGLNNVKRGGFTYGEYLQVRRTGYIHIWGVSTGEESGVHSHTGSICR